LIYTYKGKELHGENGWYDAFDLCYIIGFHSPRDTIRRYVAKENQRVVGLDTYINEDGVWSLVFAPTVRTDTKKEVSKWLRGCVLEEGSKRAKATGTPNEHHSEAVSIKIGRSEKEINITIMM